MNIYIRLGGAAIISIGALLVSKEYEKHMKKRLEEYSGLVALLSYAEGQISQFLAYGSELWSGFENSALEKCGMLEALREGKSLYEAFELCSPKTSLPSSVAKEIYRELSSLGRGYLDSELALLRGIRERLSVLLDEESVQAEKNVKIARALLLGGALCAVIMAI